MKHTNAKRRDTTALVLRGFREKRFSFGITATEVASALCMTNRTLFRHLQQDGTTLTKLQNICRIAELKPLLMYTRYPISKLAESVNCSYRHVNRLFIKYVGISPAQYREMHQ